ncbi:MAG: magnesium chelatase, partial [Candidatus Magasanikbacteria bacterium]|nr:magnesium chelatase [Candidatus Magasanikbacteria bacterium]
PNEIREYCQLDEVCLKLLREAMIKMKFSGRAFHRILKMARTIADLAEKEKISLEHLAEALQYRGRTE